MHRQADAVPALTGVARGPRPRRTTSRPPTRASSKSPARWASPRCRATAGRRSSKRSASPSRVIDKYFTGTASRIQGVDLDDDRPRVAAPASPGAIRPSNVDGDVLPSGGFYQWRREGEYHMWNPDTIAKLQHAVRRARPDHGLPHVQGIRQAGQRRERPAPQHDPRDVASSSIRNGRLSRSIKVEPASRRSSSASSPAR